MITPTLNPNVPFLIKFNTDFLVGAIIRSGAGGDATKEAAKATLVVNVATGAQTILGGDVTDGIAEIESALGTSNADPAIQAEIQTVIAYIGAKAVAVQQFLSGTVSGSLATLIGNQVATEAIAIAQKYIPAAGQTAAATGTNTAAPAAAALTPAKS